MSVPSKAPIPAATLVLFHEADDGTTEHLMIERAAGMAFAAGALVFPGGRIDDDDHHIAKNARFFRGTAEDPEDRAGRIGAIRETIEETGVTVGIVGSLSDETVAEWRRALKGGTPFSELLTAADIVIDLDALTPFARWCPNLGEHRRFDTRFYIAHVAERTAILVDPDEARSHRWITARGALAAAAAGTLHIIFPTLRNLERLDACGTYQATVSHARATPAQVISPEIRKEDGDDWLCIPVDAGYPVTRARLSELVGP